MTLRTNCDGEAQRSPDHKGILRAGLRTVFRSVERKLVSGYRQFHETTSKPTLA